MSLATFNTLVTYVNETKVPQVIDNLFKKRNIVQRMMIENRIDFNGRVIDIPMIHARSTLTQDISQMDTFNLDRGDYVTAATYTPDMKVTPITISKEDEIRATNAGELFNLVDTNILVSKMSMEEKMTKDIWSRTASSASPTWLNFANIMSASTALGGLTPSNFGDSKTWAAQVLAAASAFGTNGDPTDATDLVDSTKDVYMPKMIRQFMARTSFQKNSPADLLVMPQHNFDLLQDIIKPQQLGTPMAVKAAELGLEFITYAGTTIVHDNNMVKNADETTGPQTSDTDGRWYAFNFGVDAELGNGEAIGVRYAINPLADFFESEWIRPANQLSKTMHIEVYGNVVTGDRRSQGMVTGILSTRAYAAG
jgi:hypothetical protein